MHQLKKWQNERKRGNGPKSRLTDGDIQWIIAARQEGVKWPKIEAQYGFKPGAGNNICLMVLRRTGVDIRTMPRQGNRVYERRILFKTVKIAETPAVSSAFAEYDAYQLWRRRFSVQQIAAILHKPYREVRAAIEARA